MTNSVQAYRFEILTEDGRRSPFQHSVSGVESDANTYGHDQLVERATFCLPEGELVPRQDHDIPDPDCSCGLYAVTDRSSLATTLWMFEENRAALVSGRWGSKVRRDAARWRFIVLGGRLHDPMGSPLPQSDRVTAVNARGPMDLRELGLRRCLNVPFLRVGQGDPYTTMRGSRFIIESCVTETTIGSWRTNKLLPPVDDLIVLDSGVKLSDWVEQ